MRIKILFFIENLSGGGAEKVLRNLVNEMDQSRFDITVQTLWKGNPESLLAPGIRYRYCYEAMNPRSVLRSRIEASLGLIYRLHIADAYDIETAYLEFGSTKILSRSTNRNAKKIAWVHSDMARKLNGREKTRKKLARQYEAYDHIVCVSQTAKDNFVHLFGRENEVCVLYNTLDDREIREKAAQAPGDFPQKRRLTALAAGRLSPEKRYDLLLRVHKRLLDGGLPHDLWIVGEGGEREKLETVISENRLEDSVRLLGFQANPYPYMQAADLLVCSSRYEGLSTFVAEGLILGRPIVTTECSGMRELLGDSEAGLIVDNSEAAFQEGMERMLRDAALRDAFAERAKLRAARFSASRITGETEKFFIRLAEDVSDNG